MKISLDNLILSAKTLPEDIDRNLQPYIAAKCGIKAGDVLSYRIVKRSVDARRKGDIKLLYTLVADLPDNVKSALPLSPPRNLRRVQKIFLSIKAIFNPR